MHVRNFLFDKGVFESTSFDLPVISVGNLTMGGTGKSPHTMYLIELLKPHHKIAVLSRGYGRKSKGYILANENSDAKKIGDEPYQYYKRYGKEGGQGLYLLSLSLTVSPQLSLNALPLSFRVT